MRSLLILAVLWMPLVAPYKILFFVPQLSNSQTLINYRLADLLASRGHKVTMYRPVYHPGVTKGSSKLARTIVVPAADTTRMMEVQEEMQGDHVFGPSVMSPSLFTNFMGTFLDACETQIENRALIAELKAEKFDLAFAHHYDACPFGLMRLMDIKSYIWRHTDHTRFVSGPLPEYMAGKVGAPQAPSYVPNIMSAMTDRMTPFERLKNAIGVNLQTFIVDHFVLKAETELFRKHHGSDFPDLSTLAAKSPLVFVNSEELLDFPRPVLHKILYMGGVGMRDGKPGTLPKDMQNFLDNSRDGNIYISFGSVANMSHVPMSWLNTFAETAAALPGLHFVLKCDTERAKAHPRLTAMPNVHVGEWLPQREILAHPKTKAFVTHGGFNSYIESSFAGVPMVPIPLFGDQWSNARRAERHGMGLSLDKLSFDAAALTHALKRITQEPQFMSNARRLAKMLARKPFSPEDVVVRWTEFLAEYQTLPNLEPLSIEQSGAEYHLLDVFVGGAFAVGLALWLIYRVLRTYWWWCFHNHTAEGSRSKAAKID